MKKLFMGTALALGLSTTMVAASDLRRGPAAEPIDGFAVIGYGQYAVESETLETGLGVGWGIFDRLLVTGMFIGEDTATTDFEFESLEIGVDYSVTGNISLYATLSSDSDFNYDEFLFGASFSF
jgi:hypothetical protein